MKILVITQYYYPEQFRITDICEELVKRGHQITVLTGLPNYPEGKILKEYKWFRNRKQTINKVKVIRVSLIGRGNSSVKLMLNYLSFMINSTLKAVFMKNEFDCCYIYEVSPITQVLAGTVLRKVKNLPLYINCQDVWPEVLKISGMKESSFIFKSVLKFSKWLYQSADKITISSEEFRDYLVKVCEVNHRKIIYIPNHAESIYLEFNNSFIVGKKLKYLFAGNIGKAQNLKSIVLALTKLDKNYLNKMEINILGDGSYLNEFKKLVYLNKLDNIFIFHGRRGINEIRRFYEEANYFIITLEGGSFISKTIPAKLQGYMGAGKPILGCIDGGAMKIIRESDCGLCCNSNDIEEFSKIFIRSIDNADEYKQKGCNGREYFIKNFKIDKYVEGLESVLRRNENV